MELDFAAQTFERAHHYLELWATRFISAAGASRVASIAMARLFQQATVLWDTQQGPWAELIDLAVPALLRQALAEGKTTLGPVESYPFVPDEGFLLRFCTLYVLVYRGAQLAQWSLSERDQVTRSIRMNMPYATWPGHPEEWLNSDRLGAPPLRRAFEQVGMHECGGDLVCQAAAEALSLEVSMSLLWAKEARRLQGAMT
jgi:hypothetical protein